MQFASQILDVLDVVNFGLSEASRKQTTGANVWWEPSAHQRAVPKGVHLGRLSDRGQELAPLLGPGALLQLEARVSEGLVAPPTLLAHLVVDAELLARAEGDHANRVSERDRVCGYGGRRGVDRGCVILGEGGLADLGHELGQLTVGARGVENLRGKSQLPDNRYRDVYISSLSERLALRVRG